MKIIILLLTVALLFSFTGCTAKEVVNQNSSNFNDNFAINIPEIKMSSATQNETSSQTATKSKKPEDIIEIKEKMFIAQINDIYINVKDYLGKTIKYEGIFKQYTVMDTDKTYCSVIRYGPGCCGSDGNAGFEVKWDKDYPDMDDWVEAVGVLEQYEEDGFSYLQLKLSSLTALEQRGKEYVIQ